MSRALGSAALALLVAGCATVGAPTLVELRNGTIHGIGEGPITLRDGAWEGEPFQPGGASRPRVTLWDQPIAVGNLDARSGDEVAAILSASTGGSANLVYVAVFGRRDDGRPTPAVAALVGDRVKVHAMSIAERQVTLDIVEAGPGDPACCPSRLARKSYILQGAALVPVASTAGGNVSLTELAGTEWTLSSLDASTAAGCGGALLRRAGRGVACALVAGRLQLARHPRWRVTDPDLRAPPRTRSQRPASLSPRLDAPGRSERRACIGTARAV